MSPPRALLVTGAGSGIGRHLAETLAAAGHPVYAGARRDGDLEELSSLPGVTPLRLDVTRPDEVQAARAAIERAGTGLYGVVNNAGVGPLGYLAAFTDEDLRRLFEVNVFGVHRVTNAFLPMVLAARGRVVIVGSQGGVLSKKLFGPYTMTKHALESYVVALDEELAPHGARAAIVQPGGVVSRIGESAREADRARFLRTPPPFDEEARQVVEWLDAEPQVDDDAPESETNRKPSSPEIVAVAVRDALFAERPRLRYLVGTRWEGDRVLNNLMEKLLDANDSPSHGDSREELMALLTRHWEERHKGG